MFWAIIEGINPKEIKEHHMINARTGIVRLLIIILTYR